jgi:hypothetical protein
MHCVFGLMVTGKGERDFLPSFFRSLPQRANCSFRVMARIGQRDPIASPARKLKMVGSGKIIPTEDEKDIGLPARRFARDREGDEHCRRFLILIDDVEAGRRSRIEQVYERYRRALDTMLSGDERRRVAVHFLANMLEAYYFANSAAINEALGTAVLAGDYDGDVEEIPHPKNEIKNLFAGFDERNDGAKIVPRLDLDHILRNPETCAFLRSLFGWCVARLSENAEVWHDELTACYRLEGGRQEALTRDQ